VSDIHEIMLDGNRHRHRGMQLRSSRQKGNMATEANASEATIAHFATAGCNGSTAVGSIPRPNQGAAETTWKDLCSS
jgi:hypothetical protein